MIRLLLVDSQDTLLTGQTLLPSVPEALGCMGKVNSQVTIKVAKILPNNQALHESWRDTEIPPELVDALKKHGLGHLIPEAETPLSDREASPAETLLVTGNRDHATSARSQGIGVLFLQEDEVPNDEPSFRDWSQAPLLMRNLLEDDSDDCLAASLALALSVNYGLEETYLQTNHLGNNEQARLDTDTIPSDGKVIALRAKYHYPVINPGLGQLDGIYVPFPVSARVQLSSRGSIDSVTWDRPEEEAFAEVEGFLGTLLERDQILLDPNQKKPGATHKIEIQEDGRRYLSRLCFR